jgi:flagellar biosynthesis protein FlhF
VAAVDQLREYANLLGVEMQVAFSGQELKRHLERFAEKDVVFIDTPGRSQFDQFGINGIKENIQAYSDLSVLLAIPANIRREDAQSVYENYKVLGPAGIVLTKIDETSRCDGLTALFEVSQLPVLYVATGQRVPEDIEEATPGRVAGLIMPQAAIAGNGVKE